MADGEELGLVEKSTHDMRLMPTVGGSLFFSVPLHSRFTCFPLSLTSFTGWTDFHEYPINFCEGGTLKVPHVARYSLRRCPRNQGKTTIYCDESGKNQRYNLVGSLWINDGYRLFKVYKDLSTWKTDKGIEKELHFTNLKPQDKDIIREFITRVLGQSDALGFKAVILDSHAVQNISAEDRNFRLHYQLILKGIEHEVEKGRFSLPRNISVTKDKDEGADRLRLTELEQKLMTECQSYFAQEIIVDSVSAEESHSSVFIQLTDLFAASINRKINSPGSNYKDELADLILNLLGIKDVNNNQNSPMDFATILWI